MTVIGKHVYGELYNIQVLPTEEELREIVVEAAKKANMTIVEVVSYTDDREENGGVSAIVIVVESHIAVHTWNKDRYATVDVYTCGENSDPWLGFEHIVKSLKPEYYEVSYADRSLKKRLWLEEIEL